ncbi:hypothetical protein GCM10010446_55610 [Streptomyces enissocaesilis]|uniref:4Fe-4S Mo/W bis-MGD-type domain-containing protein n=1 Tax=Streptomyces enissocaesilis TaxID=332589 RepID=A0ABP6K4N5_9ACTN
MTRSPRRPTTRPRPDPSAASSSARKPIPARTGCDLTLHVQDNEIAKATSPHDNPVTHGSLCIKGRSGHPHVRQH